MQLLEKTISGITGDLNEEVMEKTQAHFDFLLKPQGSFGKMEEIIIKIAGMKGEAKPQVNKKAMVMMCADNGVYEEDFHSYPQEITALVAELSGDEGIVGGSVFAKFANAQVVTVDIGVKSELKGPHIINKKVRYGTNNITKGPAMTKEEAVQAIEAGIEIVNELITSEGIDLLAVGEAGICNTTTSSAILAVLADLAIEEVVDRGSGLDDMKYLKKIEIVKKAIEVNQPNKEDVLDVLAKVGGLEIAGMIGCYLGAAYHSIPVIIDGFISGVAALLALKMAPESKNYMLPSHCSAEKAGQILMDTIGLKPYIYLDMRLGEGTGALLACNIIDCGIKVLNEMGTFDDIK